MSLFVLADLHLSTSLDKPMDVFGVRWHSYMQKINDGWRAVVGENDTVIVPGDISWGISLEVAESDLRFLDSLPGKKIIGRGNHDYWWSSAKKIEELFEKTGITTISLLHNNAHIVENTVICGSRGWWNDEKNAPKDADYEKLVLREAGRLEYSIKRGIELWQQNGCEGEPEILAFLHFPPIFREYDCPEIRAVLEKYSVKKCFFGHIHAQYDMSQSFEYNGVRYSIISADFLNFIPHKIRL